MTLNGTWSNAAGSTIAASGATLNLGNSSNVWSNAGTISAVNSTVNLGGQFTLAALGTFNRTAGTVNLVGTLNNTGTTLALNATTGSWNLVGGTLASGTLTDAGSAELVFTSSGGTLDGVTAASDLDLASNNGAFAYVKDGLTLSNSTVHLGNAAGSTYGYLYFEGTQTLGGTGTVLFGKNGSNTINQNYGGTTLTIGPRVTVRGSSGTLGGAAIVNQGTISADDSGGLAGNFVYDQGFTGGSASDTSDPIDTRAVSNPAPQAVYQTFRYGYGAFSYTLTGLTPGASYTVPLDFADLVHCRRAAAVQRGHQRHAGADQFRHLRDGRGQGQGGAGERSRPRRTPAARSPWPSAPGPADYALVNGIEVLSGGTVVQADQLRAVGRRHDHDQPQHLHQPGELAGQQRRGLNVNGLTGNLGSGHPHRQRQPV